MGFKPEISDLMIQTGIYRSVQKEQNKRTKPNIKIKKLTNTDDARCANEPRLLLQQQVISEVLVAVKGQSVTCCSAHIQIFRAHFKCSSG